MCAEDPGDLVVGQWVADLSWAHHLGGTPGLFGIWPLSSSQLSQTRTQRSSWVL